MGYGTYIAFRLVNFAVILVIITLMTCAIFDAAMTKILKAQIAEQVNQEVNNWIRTQQQHGHAPTQEEIEAFRQARLQLYYERYGLNKPMWMRVFYRTWDVLRFKFGKTVSEQINYAGSRDVATVIFGYLPNSIILFTTGAIITMVIGIFLGLQMAKRAGGKLDRAITTFAMVSYSLPMWWTGMLLIFLFAFELRIFPAGGMHTLPPPEDPVLYWLDFLWHLALPLITIVLVTFGGWAYTTRSLVLGTLQQDFVMAARAKGLPERKVLYGHVLRAVSPSLATMCILSIVNSMWGAMISEAVFNWPGIGRLYWIAIDANDIAVVIGLTYVSTFIWLISLIIIDLIYGLLDPRIRVGIKVTR